MIELLSSAYRPVELELIHVESGSVNIRRLLFRATGTSTGTHLFYIMFAVLWIRDDLFQIRLRFIRVPDPDPDPTYVI